MVGNQSEWLTGLSFVNPYLLYSRSSGGSTVTDNLSSPSAEDDWRIEVEGTTIRLYKNNNLLITKSNCKMDYPRNLRLYPYTNSGSCDWVKIKPL